MATVSPVYNSTELGIAKLWVRHDQGCLAWLNTIWACFGVASRPGRIVDRWDVRNVNVRVFLEDAAARRLETSTFFPEIEVPPSLAAVMMNAAKQSRKGGWIVPVNRAAHVALLVFTIERRLPC